MYKLIIGSAFGLLLFNGTAMAACSVPYTFTSGTTADASQVNGNFTSLTGCAAPIASPSFTGTVTLGSGLANYLTINGNTTGEPAYINTAGSDTNVGIDFNTKNTGRFRVNVNGSTAFQTGADGSFLVGTTTNGGSVTGNAKGEFRQTASLGAALSATFEGSIGRALVSNVENTGADLISFTYQKAQKGSITTNGTTTSYNTTSDERLKNWKIPQRSYRSAIERIWVGDFKWKKNGAPDFGYRAQQAYSLFPAAVHKPSDSKGTWEMDYGKTAALAMWGVKDLYKATDDQSRSVLALQMEVKRLRAQTVALQQVHTNDAAKLERLEHLVMSLKRTLVVQAALK